ncbi:ERF superfamily protein (plasmid) [Borrelia crocidurae DOU]|uniref:ERF superfamily protein n=1 Tax=Borrelia crocidurae DOU TaxID=1293575 RepID=W5SLT0_9SPIR|nr:recombinase RecT [Borrelia crocidurae]AHH07643.1 ERF superfamily protein [Borrelia crocidurae DOU]
MTKNNISKTNTVDVIIDKMNSSNIAEVWETYKSMHNLKKIDAYSEREILTLLQVNKLNPFKKEAYIIPFNGRYTVVVAYQTLLIRAYEAGYNKYDLDFEEKLVKSLKIDSKGNKMIQEDWQCTAFFKSDDGIRYSFSVLLSEYFKNTPVWREKPVFMLRKCAVSCLCRTLPGSGLESMPYIREELEDMGTVLQQELQGFEEITNSTPEATIEIQSVNHNSGDDINKSIPTKYYCYQNLLIASRNMYNFLSDKPFGSLSEINDYLESVKSGDDSKLLEYFNKNKMLKSIEYWCNLIKEYFTKSSRDLSTLEKFNIFMAFDLDKIGNSPLKLFSQLSITKEFQCLFSLT